MRKIVTGSFDFRDVVGICSAGAWRAKFSDRQRPEPLLYWVLLKDGRTFGIVQGTANPEVADEAQNFEKYVFSE